MLQFVATCIKAKYVTNSPLYPYSFLLRNGSLFFCIFQTSFVDCLIEQTHPQIEAFEDRDVSCSYKLALLLSSAKSEP